MDFPINIIRSLGVVVILTAAPVLSGCGKNQNVDLSFSTYTVAKAKPMDGGQVMLAKSEVPKRFDAPSMFLLKLDNWLDGLFPKAHAAISSIKLCFKRLRFKQEGESTSGDPTLDDDNVDLTLGLVTLSTTGTSLTSVEIPPATYKRIEFDLEDGCGTGYSLYVDNSGIYQTTDRITIKFDGTFDASSAALAMSVQNIVTGLSSVTAGSQLKSAAEGVSGSF